MPSTVVLRGRDLDRLRIPQDRPGQAPDVVGERRREHEVLAALRQQLDDALDVGQEAHVEHPVGLVEDEDLDLAQVRDLLADEVEQATGRRDEDLDPGAQRLDLRVHGDAAVDDGRAQRHGPAVGPDALIDLHRELARGHEDQGADRVAGRRERRVRVRPEAIEDRQRERGGLAGAGLGRREDVASGEDEGDGGFLDRRRGGVALFGDGLEQIGRQAERCRRSSVAPARDPGRRGRGSAGRDGGVVPRAPGRGRTWAVRSIAGNQRLDPEPV